MTKNASLPESTQERRTYSKESNNISGDFTKHSSRKHQTIDPEALKAQINKAWDDSKPLTQDEAIERSRIAMNTILKESLKETKDSLGF